MQFSLEGKKKFTAYLVGIISSVIGLLVTTGIIGEGTADAVTSVMAVAAPILGAALYDWFQSRHDVAKEYAKAEIARSRNSAPSGTATGTCRQYEQTAPAVQPGEKIRPVDDFDQTEFISYVHSQAVDTASSMFPAAPTSLTSILRAAEQVGTKIPCTDIRQAEAYWDYLAELAEDAWKQLEFDNRDAKGCKLFPPQLYEARANTRRINAFRNSLQRMIEANADWSQARSSTTALPTLYSIGLYAGERY